MKIGIANLEINNIKSVKDFFSIFGQTYILDSFKDYQRDTNIFILPGNGTFKAGSESARKKEIDKLLKEIKNKNVLIIGICLGMQLFFEKSAENADKKGLGFFEGEVKEIKTNNCRLPLLGWFETSSKNTEQDKKTFFFNNKFSCFPKKNLYNTAYLDLDDFKVLASIKKYNVIGFQFHPEKSSKNGYEVIKKLIEDYEKF